MLLLSLAINEQMNSIQIVHPHKFVKADYHKHKNKSLEKFH